MINARDFIRALDSLEKEKGISKESIINALKEALEKGFIKQLGITDDMEEARVRVDIDPKKATIAMYNIKRVVEEVQDDFVEISVEDANENGGNYKVGDDYEIEVPTDDLTKLTAQNVKSVLKQKLAECEKAAIFDTYIDKKDEMIDGTVEKVDDRMTIINIGRTNVCLPRSQKIKNETFKVGQIVKLYVVDVVSTPKGPQIIVSRTEAGLLKRLFENIISEIPEGRVIIKDIAREAGERSKVAVYSTDENIDPVGTCIGVSGARIQSISSELGNNKEKENIDIVQYNENPALYIADALRPAIVVGVALDEKEKKAVAVVKNDQLSLAIGKKGVNARLAVKLTGWNIDIKEIDEALRENVIYKSIEQIKSEEEMKKLSKIKPETVLDTLDEEIFEEPESEEEFVEDVVEPTNEKVEETVEENVAPVKEDKPVVEQKVIVKETKKLADLEKELEEEKKRRDQQQAYANRKRNYKKNEVSEEEVEEEKENRPVVDKSTYMSIYTEEEIRQLEEEEAQEDTYEEEVDYDEYDSYYNND